ncbi:hypothetical protein M231_02932 [Tremella mesenterica]|uniref:Nuclear movement protein nudC n=1 Tax=Tremella mesenterica TaxID=5217 RepID=A0A4Q1BPB5_TREME|nr:hypothetical protein M231_02932 [Tremella mesenterica]
MSSTSTAPYDSMTPEQRQAHDTDQKEKERQEQAALPYSWSQELGIVTVTVSLPKGTRGRDVNVVLEKRRLKVQLKSAPEPILDGELFNDISKDDSSWTIRQIIRGDAHLHTPQWWPHVLTHHPKIDTTKIQPDNSKLSDLDGDMRTMVEKMMFDNQQKAMGKPTSDEMKKAEMLQKFKKMHPEMDFSQAKFS